MAKERDYKRKYELEKDKKKDVSVGTNVLKQTAEDLKSKLELDGITRNAFLRSCIECFLNDEITLEQLHLR